MKTISLGTDNIKYGTIFKTFIFRIIEIIEKKARFAASRNTTKYYNFTFFVKLNIFFSCSTLRHPFLLSLIFRKKDKHFEFYKFWIIACSKNSLISRKKGDWLRLNRFVSKEYLFMFYRDIYLLLSNIHELPIEMKYRLGRKKMKSSHTIYGINKNEHFWPNQVDIKIVDFLKEHISRQFYFFHSLQYLKKNDLKKA